MNMTTETKPLVVSLKEAVDAMDTMSDQIHSYLHLKTGRWISLSEEILSMAEDDSMPGDHPDWEQEMILIARDILTTDDYLELPDRFEIHEYNIMREFCLSREGRAGDDLVDQIRGKGAFGRFRNAVRRHRIEDQWYQFREKAMEEIAIAWLDRNHIAYQRP
ncbi:MAG: hypothetical protein EG826_16585 [Deltaproteobacteria bacterium]|nr:hypothetical protein [Deltaproteobacteria bacterium]